MMSEDAKGCARRVRTSGRVRMQSCVRGAERVWEEVCGCTVMCKRYGIGRRERAKWYVRDVGWSKCARMCNRHDAGSTQEELNELSQRGYMRVWARECAWECKGVNKRHGLGRVCVGAQEYVRGMAWIVMVV